MNPMAREFLVTVLRYALAAGGSWMVSRGILTAEQSAAYVNEFSVGLTVFLIALGSALWSRYKSRQHLVMALAGDMPQTESEVKAQTKAGMAPTVTTPATQVPQ